MMLPLDLVDELVVVLVVLAATQEKAIHAPLFQEADICLNPVEGIV